MATEDPNAPEGTIAVSLALDMTSNWRTYLNENNPGFYAQSYYIPIIALQNMVQYNPDADGVRVYIGLNDPGDLTTTKLLFIPVVGGKEMPYRDVSQGNGYGDGDGDCDTDDCSNIYNLNEPCPPNCAPGGPPNCFLDA